MKRQPGHLLANVLAVCMVVPTILGFLAGSPLLAKPQWLLRGLIFIWPLYYMLLATTLSRSRARIYLLGAAIGLQAGSLYPYYTTYLRWGDIAAFEYLNRYATPDDLIVVDPWYMHDMVDYYFGGTAPMAGYDPVVGWIDVEAMQASGTWGLVPLNARPAPRGNIYVFYRRELKWADMFPNAQIVVYDPATASWYRYAGIE